MTQSNEDLAAHLELVEQNITLTLQQIDHNFAACHNTVATKLLPRVDRFGDISSSIWEGSQAWLRFFESLESSQHASIPLPPSPTETTNTSERSERVELSTRLEFSQTNATNTTSIQNHAVIDAAPVVEPHSNVFASPHWIPRRPAPPSQESSRILQQNVSSRLSSMAPPSLHFQSLNSPSRASTHATPMKARGPRPAGTPSLLRKVLLSNQRKTPKIDHHALFDAATPYSDASSDVESSTDRFLQMNSPPVTLQFTLPANKTPGRTAVDALLEEMSPISNTPSGASARFLTRLQALSDHESSDSTVNPPLLTNLPSSSASQVPSFVRRHQSESQVSATPMTTGREDPPLSAMDRQFVTDLDDIDALLEMSEMPITEAARQQLRRLSAIHSPAADPITNIAAKTESTLTSLAPSGSATGWTLGTPSRTTTARIASTPMPSDHHPHGHQHDRHHVQTNHGTRHFPDVPSMSFGVSALVDPSQSQLQHPPHVQLDARASQGQHADAEDSDEEMGVQTDVYAPPAFRLELFPDAFQQPPGSIELRKLYDVFEAHADQALDMATLVQLLPEFGAQRIQLLADLLTRRHLLRKRTVTGQPQKTQWVLNRAP